jgi:hypothetical protein
VPEEKVEELAPPYDLEKEMDLKYANSDTESCYSNELEEVVVDFKKDTSRKGGLKHEASTTESFACRGVKRFDMDSKVDFTMRGGLVV